VLTPSEPVVGRRGDQECGGNRGEEEGRNEDLTLAVRDPRELVREWDGQQECEQHLHPRQHDSELVQKLDQLAIEAIALVLALAHRRV
jgi:hypothetical protein